MCRLTPSVARAWLRMAADAGAFPLVAVLADYRRHGFSGLLVPRGQAVLAGSWVLVCRNRVVARSAVPLWDECGLTR